MVCVLGKLVKVVVLYHWCIWGEYNVKYINFKGTKIQDGYPQFSCIDSGRVSQYNIILLTYLTPLTMK